MSKRAGWTSGILIFVTILLAGCGGSAESPPTSVSSPGSTATLQPSTAVPSRAPSVSASVGFIGKVDVHSANPDCAKVTCWLPTQFEPKLVERESVSLVEKVAGEPGGPQRGWPMDGDSVAVQCLAQGGQNQDRIGPYQNPAGQLSYDWYGIVVPIDKLNPDAKGDPRLLDVEQGKRAYVAISWISGGKGKLLPACF